MFWVHVVCVGVLGEAGVSVVMVIVMCVVV